MRKYIILFGLLVSMVACEKESPSVETCKTEYSELLPGEMIMRVNHYKESCEHPMLADAVCLLVQQESQLCSGDWSYFYDEIEGFQYEEGYVYVLKVKVEEMENPPMDGSSLRYTLVEVISKEEQK